MALYNDDLYGGYPGGVSIQPSSAAMPAGSISPRPQLQPPSYSPGGLDSHRLSVSPESQQRVAMVGEGRTPMDFDQGSQNPQGPGFMENVGNVSRALSAGASLYGSFNGGGQGGQPADQSMYPTGMPRRPHPAAVAQATGNTLSDTGSALLVAAPMSGPAAPYMAVTGLAAKAVGSGMQLYAALKNVDQAEEEYKALMREWEKMKAREEADYKREVERQRQSDIMGKSAHSAALADRFASSYGGYRQGGQING